MFNLSLAPGAWLAHPAARSFRLGMGRPLRGSRLASFYSSDTQADPVTPPSLSTLDSAFQLQEYIGALVRLDPHDIDRIIKVPGRNANTNGDEREKEGDGEDERVSIDEACWIYEQLRRLAQDLTHPLITMLQQECTRQTCPEMKAGEWLYLCVAHGNSGAMEHCCAIDYIVHTLDSATALLNSPRAFPSRISIPQTSHRHFPSLARRLGRIFAHAYYHHRLAFESAEAESGLYARFLALSRQFDLVPAEFLVIPERSEQGEEVRRRDEDMDRKNVTLLTRDHENPTSPPPSAIPTTSTTSPSPRLGGRSRTDTMYLSGGYVSPHSRGSPRASPRPNPQRILSSMTTTSAEENQDQKTQEVSITLPNDMTEDVVTQRRGHEGKDQVGEQTSDTKDISVMPRIPGQVIARDFALESLLPVAGREHHADAAESTGTPIEDVSCSIELADPDPEQDDTSSYLKSLGDTPDLLSSKPDNITMLASDSIDLTPAPSFSSIPLFEPYLPAVASHISGTQDTSVFSIEDEIVEPAPSVEILSEELEVGADRNAGGEAEGEGEGHDEVKEEKIATETETPVAVVAQQETVGGNETDNIEKPLESENI